MGAHKVHSRLQSRYSICSSVHNHSGFTLIELLMVMAIIALLSTMAMAGFYAAQDRARTARAMSEIRTLEKEIAAYATDHATYPAHLFDINRATAGSPDVCTLLDPWKQPYVYSLMPTRTAGGGTFNTDFDLYSKGPDMISVDSSIIVEADDIVRANNGSFIGSYKTWGL